MERCDDLDRTHFELRDGVLLFGGRMLYLPGEVGEILLSENGDGALTIELPGGLRFTIGFTWRATS